MFNNQTQHQNQFVITHELFSLIVWMIENEHRTIAKLVQKAFASGFKEHIQKNKSLNDNQLLEHAQQAIIDFFGILESHMLDSLYEQSVKRALEKNILPAIDNLDTTNCDDDVIRTSIQKATQEADITREDAKKTLYRELLKRWKPTKNPSAH